MDIENNNHAFAHEFFKSLQSLNISVSIASSPMVPDSLAAVLGVDQETREITQLSAVGCSDDERYSGEWRAENYAAVTLLSIIGCLILVGSLMDLYDRFPIGGKPNLSDVKKPAAGLGYKILTAFSAVTNLEYIFKRSPVSGKGQRLSCLEGMRAISMTWVILGHTFYFAMPYLDNPVWALDKIQNSWSMEGVVQGPFSVDSFFFLSGLLVSYIFLKRRDSLTKLTSPLTWAKVILHRFIRLLPPYLALVVLLEPLGKTFNLVDQNFTGFIYLNRIV